tara:strand:+ start:1655 stop:1888 length:234 start_codon:yes stop_codon:yes gene_type:complete
MNNLLLCWNVKNTARSRGVCSQKKLAEISGTDKNLVNDIWNSRQRNISAKTLGKICVALDCKPNDLLSFQSQRRCDE